MVDFWFMLIFFQLEAERIRAAEALREREAQITADREQQMQERLRKMQEEQERMVQATEERLRAAERLAQEHAESVRQAQLRAEEELRIRVEIEQQMEAERRKKEAELESERAWALAAQEQARQERLLREAESTRNEELALLNAQTRRRAKVSGCLRKFCYWCCILILDRKWTMSCRKSRNVGGSSRMRPGCLKRSGNGRWRRRSLFRRTVSLTSGILKSSRLESFFQNNGI